ncbi:hypothetical protein F5883DRAFT_527238 [Diaporthe sp. PMI_573]|nr:hypothetical protein F5883DRAFT_527238 [Diaporthaceae sp. PMI_573]
MVNEWNKSVDSPIQQLVEGGWPGYDIEDDAQYDADVSFDGYSSSTQSSVMVGESTHKTSYEGVDTVLHNLDFQMSTAGVPKDGENRLTAVTRSGIEGSRRQHTLLPADRHLNTSGDDSEFPPVPPSDPHVRITNALHDSEATQEPGHDYLASSPNSPFTPNPPTPLGPSDFDEDGNIIDRLRHNRDPKEAED